MKKILTGIGAIAAVAVIVPMFAAFEAHVVNVTATIENALSVPAESIEFGTVFPQEHLNKPLEVALSRSFLAEDRVDDVEYIIRQKPKCGITSREGTVLDHDSTQTGHIVIDDSQDGYHIDCGEPYRDLTDGESWGVLPSLCEYISKEGEDDNDETLPSFHQPWTIGPDGINWNDTAGRLAKSDNDTVDNWTIDLAVPCFGGHCAQDWEDFVKGINPDAEADDYVQPLENEHKVFGCDLWIEVTGVSEFEPEDTI